MTDAFRFEKQVQNWSRAKRIALIEGRFEALSDLASRSWSARRDHGTLKPGEPGGTEVS
jgi:putative endonuclease